jgi:hypothetical protein
MALLNILSSLNLLCRASANLSIVARFADGSASALYANEKQFSILPLTGISANPKLLIRRRIAERFDACSGSNASATLARSARASIADFSSLSYLDFLNMEPYPA